MQLVFFIVYMFEALIAFMFFNDNFKMKKGYLYTTGVAVGLYLIGFMTNIIDKNTYFINLAVFLAINIAFALLCFKTNIKEVIFSSVFLLMIMALTEVVVEASIAYIFDKPTDLYKSGISALITIAVLTKLLYLIVCKAVCLFLNRKDKSNSSNYVLFMFPLIISIIFVIWFNEAMRYNFSQKTNMVLAVLCVISCPFSAFIFIYNRHIQNQQQELFELQQQNLKNEIDMQYLDLLEKKNQQMQILTHDYKNHLAAIRELGDNEQVAEYIDKMTDEIKSSNSTSHSGNHTLDIIINKYVTECELKHILFSFDTKLSNLGFVDDFDLVTILDNVLDNALEAAEKSTDKNITLSTKKVNTYDTVVITNSCDAAPDKNLKTKKQKGTHGLGLKSVEKTIKKYSGDFEWEYSETDKTFTITIMLLNKED